MKEIDQLSDDEAMEGVKAAEMDEVPKEVVGKFSKLK